MSIPYLYLIIFVGRSLFSFLYLKFYEKNHFSANIDAFCFSYTTPYDTTTLTFSSLSRPDSVSLLISFILSLTPSCPLYVCLSVPLCLSPSLYHYLSHYLSLSSNSASSGSHAAHNGFHSSHSGLMGGSHSFSDPSLVKLPQVSYLLPLRVRFLSSLTSLTIRPYLQIRKHTY